MTKNNQIPLKKTALKVLKRLVSLCYENKKRYFVGNYDDIKCEGLMSKETIWKGLKELQLLGLVRKEREGKYYVYYLGDGIDDDYNLVVLYTLLP